MIKVGDRWVRTCVDRPVSTLAAIFAFVVLGVFAISQLKISYAPEVPESQLLVSCQASGFPSDEIRKLVTLPLEESLSSLKGLRRMESFSKSGQVVVKLDLWWGTDIRRAQIDAAQLVDVAYTRLPQSAEKPLVYPLSRNDTPSFWIAMFPKDGNLVQAREYADRELKTRIQQTEGVGGVTVVGGLEEEVRVDVHQDALFAKGLSLSSVAESLSEGNIEVPLGSIISQDRSLSLKADSKAKSIQDLASILIIPEKSTATPVRIGDIADIRLCPKRQTSFFLDNENEGILFLVGRQSGESPLTVSEHLKNKVAELQAERGRDYDFKILQDESDTVRNALTDLTGALIAGSLIAFLTLLFFLRDFRSALIIFWALPISALFAFLGLWLCGRSLNIMSLGGLALGLGMLVDNSVVVLENYSKRLMAPHVDSSQVVEATMEMAGSTIGSTLTVAIVFIPLVFLPGAMGALFTDLSLSVVFSMAASFLVSVTWVPVLYRWTRHSMPVRRGTQLESVFRGILKKSFQRPGFVVIIVFGFTTVAAVSFGLLKKELFNPIDQGIVQTTIRFEPGMEVATLKRKTAEVNRTLSQYSEIEQVVGFGGDEPDSPFFLANPQKPSWECTDLLLLKPGVDAIGFVNRLTHDLPGVECSLPPSPIEGLLNLRSDQSQWVLTAENPEVLAREVGRLAEDSLPRMSAESSEPVILIKPLTEHETQFALTPSRTAEAVGDAIDGIEATEFWKEGFPISVRVTVPDKDKQDIAALEQIQVPGAANRTDGGQMPSVALGSVASINPSSNVPILYRVDKKDAVRFQIPSDTGENELGRFRTQFPNAKNSQLGFLEENFGTLAILGLFSILFLYLYLVVQFESFVVPLMVLLTFPLSAAGIFGSLLVFGFSWNINTFFAVLILMGSSVNVAIILIENYRHRGIRSGLLVPLVTGGTLERVRPIVITTLTTVVGSLPVAVDPGHHSTQSGMATAIVGGHLVSTTLTLLVIPTIYLSWIRFKHKRAPKP